MKRIYELVHITSPSATCDVPKRYDVRSCCERCCVLQDDVLRCCVPLALLLHALLRDGSWPLHAMRAWLLRVPLALLLHAWLQAWLHEPQALLLPVLAAIHHAEAWEPATGSSRIL